MRNLIAVLLAAVVMSWAGGALAEETTTLYCINMPWCCEFSCVMVDIDCKCYCPTNDPMWVEFLGGDGMVLGSFEVPNYCCLCDEYTAMVSPAVNAGDVCSIRLRKPDNACDCLWMSLRVYCGDGCCGKWYKVFKGDVWCWQPVPVVQPMPEPEPEIVVDMPPPPADTGWEQPEPQHDYDYFPPEQEAEEEVIVVEGRG